MNILCIYARSRNENGIGTTHTVNSNVHLLLRKLTTNCEIRGSKSERMAAGGLIAPARRGIIFLVTDNIDSLYKLCIFYLMYENKLGLPWISLFMGEDV